MMADSPQQPGRQPRPGIVAAAAAYLEQHGISAAQLQQAQPELAAALTLPPARLLVMARQGLKNTLAPAELATRLVFLASSRGIGGCTAATVFQPAMTPLFQAEYYSRRFFAGWA